MELDEGSFVHSCAVDDDTLSQTRLSNTLFTVKPGGFYVYLIQFRRRETSYELMCFLILYYLTTLLP